MAQVLDLIFISEILSSTVWSTAPNGAHGYFTDQLTWKCVVSTRSCSRETGSTVFQKKTTFQSLFSCCTRFNHLYFFLPILANLNLKNATAVCGIPFLQHTKDSPAINASWFLRTWEVGKNGRMQVATRADSNKKDSDKKQLASSSKRKQEQRGKCAFLSWRMSTWTFQY